MKPKLLDFNPPIKCTAREARANPDLFDAAKADALKWKAELVVGKGGNKTVEIRKTFDAGTTFANVHIIVSKDGWDKSQHESRTPDRWGRSTRGLNVRIGTNQPMSMTFDEWAEFYQAVSEAYAIIA